MKLQMCLMKMSNKNKYCLSTHLTKKNSIALSNKLTEAESCLFQYCNEVATDIINKEKQLKQEFKKTSLIKM